MLKIKVTSEEFKALPDVLQAEYKQDGDNYTVQVDGMKLQSDVDSVLEAKRKEKETRTAAEKRIKELEGELGTLTDKVSVYENDETLKLSKEQLVEHERLKRENEALTGEKTELEAKFNGLQQEVTTSNVKSRLTKELSGIMDKDAIIDQVDILCNKFVISDGKLLTNETLGDKSGLEAKAYLTGYTEERPYLQLKSSGGGAGGVQGSGGGSHSTNSPANGDITIFQDMN